jgi:hypothetical protein
MKSSISFDDPSAGGSSFDPANPGPIGGTTPSTGAFTTLTATQNALGATTTAAATLINSTAATSGAPHQWSPAQVFSGTRWNGSASEVIQSRWVQMSPDPITGQLFGLVLQTKQGAGAWTTRASIDNSGGLNATTNVISPQGTFTNVVSTANANALAAAVWSGFGGGLFLNGGAGIRANGGATWTVTPDAFFERAAAATWQLGQTHATTATAQRIQAHGVGVGTGASLTLGGGSGDTKGNVILDGGNRSAYASTDFAAAPDLTRALIKHGLMQLGPLTGLFPSDETDTAITINWDLDETGLATQYRLEKSTDEVNYSLVDVISPFTLSYYVDSLSPDTTYYFRIRAESAYGNSEWAFVSGTTLPEPEPEE